MAKPEKDPDRHDEPQGDSVRERGDLIIDPEHDFSFQLI
jgi:hypothetical protein